MKFLFLEQNKFGDEGMAHLCHCVHKLEKLHLRNCGISNLGVQKLSQAIVQNSFTVSFDYFLELQKKIQQLNSSDLVKNSAD